jgi:hypothetical protein
MKHAERLDNQRRSATTKKHVMRKIIRKRPLKSNSASKRTSQIASALSLQSRNSHRSRGKQLAQQHDVASITVSDNMNPVVHVDDPIPILSPAHSDEAEPLMKVDMANSDTGNETNHRVRGREAYSDQRVLPASLSKAVEDQNRPAPYKSLAVDNHETDYNPPAIDADHFIERPSTCRPAVISETRNSNAKFIVIAKNVLPCNQIHDQQVMGGTRCIVQDRQGRHEIMTWSQIEQEHQRGILFEDSDFGYGIHTRVDRDFLGQFTGRNKSSNIGNFQVVDAIMHHSKKETIHYITVFLKLNNSDLFEGLSRARANVGYNYPGPIRCCVSVFCAAGGKKWDVERILKKKQPAAFKRYQESRRWRRAGKESTVYQQGKIEQFLGRYEGLFSDVASLLRRVKKIECTPA